MIRGFIIFILLNCILPEGNAQARVENHISDIRIEEQGDVISIMAIFSNQSDTLTTLKYQLKTTKEGHSGKSFSRQSGTLRAEPGEEVTLSTTKHYWQAGDMYRIRLIIYRENQAYINNIKTIRR
jgi:hypothetical protein